MGASERALRKSPLSAFLERILMDISAHLTSSCEADDKNLLIERVGDDYYRELVCESAIDPQVALEREYENSGYDWYHLVDDLGFSKWLFADHWVEPMGGCDCHGGEMTMPWWIPSGQVDLPALVVPRRSPDGETVAYEIKPKSHSFKDDRKYINPKDQGLVLDIHPRGFKHLKNTSTPVWFTEGGFDPLSRTDQS